MLRSCCAARREKAAKVFPRPVAGSLKPVVTGQTVKYNTKKRAGRGFTLEELKVILKYCYACGEQPGSRKLCWTRSALLSIEPKLVNQTECNKIS